jgi:DNA-binding NarL/FixJ family response regulator
VIRVLIVDDHVLVRRGLSELCREMGDFSVGGMATNGDEVLAVLDRSNFDLLLLDLSIPGISCRDLIRDIRVVDARMPILVFGIFDDFLVVKRVLQAGASGVVSKGSDMDTLMLAMRKVAAGGRFIDSLISEKLLFNGAISQTPLPCESLTPRERQIMGLLVRGKKVTAIAAELSISDKTVSTHKLRLMHKLNVRNDAELVRYSIDHGLIGQNR